METDESHVGEVLGGDGLIHVAGTGIECVAKELTLSRMPDATLGTINHQTETLLQEVLHRIE